MRSCPTKNQLELWLEDHPRGTLHNEVSGHVDGCAACQEMLEQITGDRELFKTLCEEYQNPDSVSAFDTSELPADYLDPPRSPGELGRLGRYSIRKVIGKGGMGIVFLAEDTRLQRKVALKVMRVDAAADRSARQRLLREARAVAAVKHDNIVTVYEAGEHKGLPFLAVELLEGMTLETHLKKSGKLPMSETLRIGIQIVHGLAAAHQQGLVHRDIKPSNIWLEESAGRVKILDFGLARKHQDAHLTSAGVIVGTPHFMSPEQTRGEKIDCRCDFFSLGGVLYQLCTGHLPFPGRDVMAILTAVAGETPAPIEKLAPDVPLSFVDLVKQLLHKDPNNRPESAEDIAKRLETIEAKLESGKRRSDSGRWLPYGVVGISAVVGIIALIAILSNHSVSVVPGRESHKTERHRNRPPNKPQIFTEPKPGILTFDLGPTHMAFSPNGEILAVASSSTHRPVNPGRVTLWHSRTYKKLQTVEKHKVPVLWVAFSRDGKRLASAAGDINSPFRPPGEIRVWDVNSGKVLAAIVDPEGPVRSVAFSPDGKLLASTSGNKIKLWDSVNGKELDTLEGSPEPVNMVLFSPDGKHLASACGHYGVSGEIPGRVTLWDVCRKTQKKFWSKSHGYESNRITFSGDGKLIASAARGDSEGFEEFVRVWEVKSGKEVCKVKGTVRSIPAVDLSRDGNYLVRSSGSHIAVWNIDPMNFVPKRIDNKYWGKSVCDVVFSPDSRYIAASSYDEKTVEILRRP